MRDVGKEAKMIKKVSELLQKIIEVENKVLGGENIKHAPTIGSMYEGLTKEVLNKCLPLESELNVASGFIIDADGAISKELDCLIVSDEGESVPYTEKKKFLVDDVVAVIEVKKNLYSSNIEDGYKNLQSVMEFVPQGPVSLRLFEDAFSKITRMPLPGREDIVNLSFETQMIYHALLTEVAAPARIIFGYNGFKSHSGFRQSYVAYLSRQLTGGPIKGFGPTSFPSLIVCGNYSLVKCNGIPYAAPVEKNYSWQFYCSSESNPIEILLEIIWTKLVYNDKLDSSVFGDDITLQPFSRFISTKPSQGSSGEKGWVYEYYEASDDKLSKPDQIMRWEPAFLDNIQVTIVHELCDKEEIDLSDPKLSSFLAKNQYTVDTLTESLNKLGLAARVGNRLVLLTRECACLVLPDGRYAAGENVAGQLTQWLNIYLEEHSGKSAD